MTHCVQDAFRVPSPRRSFDALPAHLHRCRDVSPVSVSRKPPEGTCTFHLKVPVALEVESLQHSLELTDSIEVGGLRWSLSERCFKASSKGGLLP